MSKIDEKTLLYRILFTQDDKLYEVYARYISEETLVGFLEIEELVFQNNPNTLVVDPGEEKLRIEFKDVRRSYVPIHLILRIDEVYKEGLASIREVKDQGTNISPFPGNFQRTPSGE